MFFFFFFYKTDVSGMQLCLKAITAKVLKVSSVVSEGVPQGGGTGQIHSTQQITNKNKKNNLF